MWDVIREEDTSTIEHNVTTYNNYPIIKEHYSIIGESNSDIKLRFKGSYLICDGGYHRWSCLINPFHMQPPGTDLERWSKALESLRKDIECVFGILKLRFKILKHPIRMHSPEAIHKMFVTCCVLHNLLLDYDGRDTWRTEAGSSDGNSTEYDVLEETAERIANTSVYGGTGVAGTRVGRREMYLGGEEQEHLEQERGDANGTTLFVEEEAYDSRRMNLIKHYQRMLKFRLVRVG